MNKDEQIRWMNSLTNASKTVSSFTEGKTIEEVKELVEDMANWFYRVSPIGSDLEAKINACNNREELDNLKDEVLESKNNSIFASYNEKILELQARESLSK